MSRTVNCYPEALPTLHGPPHRDVRRLPAPDHCTLVVPGDELLHDVCGHCGDFVWVCDCWHERADHVCYPDCDHRSPGETWVEEGDEPWPIRLMRARIPWPL